MFWINISSVYHEYTLNQAIYQGLNYDYTKAMELDPPQCSTSECRWPSFSSLELCVDYWNVTEYLNVTKGPGGVGLEMASLPNGVTANLSTNFMTLVSLSNGQKPIFSEMDDAVGAKPALFNFSLIYITSGSGAVHMGAIEAMIYFCVKRYNVSITENLLSRKVISTSANATFGEADVEGYGRMNTTIMDVPEEPGTTFTIGGAGLSSMYSKLRSAMNGTYSDYVEDPQALGLAAARYQNGISYDPPDLIGKNNGKVPKDVIIGDAIANITDNVVTSLSNTSVPKILNETYLD